MILEKVFPGCHKNLP